ncbi:LysR substrate-binding domain-containing protein [Nonomuraea dietziae]|uniref:LysR substrate-binding domain-containing protein n=1 Tax=Nonomuraea dietziae TaxID=65515 RepID=UPI003437F3BE
MHVAPAIRNIVLADLARCSPVPIFERHTLPGRPAGGLRGGRFRPEFAVDGENYATAQGFLAAGLEVTLIPRLALPSPHPGVVVRELSDPAPVRSIHTAVRETSLGQPALTALLNALHDRWREEGS